MTFHQRENERESPFWSLFEKSDEFTEVIRYVNDDTFVFGDDVVRGQDDVDVFQPWNSRH